MEIHRHAPLARLTISRVEGNPTWSNGVPAVKSGCHQLPTTSHETIALRKPSVQLAAAVGLAYAVSRIDRLTRIARFMFATLIQMHSTYSLYSFVLSESTLDTP